MNTTLQALAVLLCAGVLPAFQDEPVIDLTRPAAQTSPIRFPGLTAGSSSGGHLGPGVHSIPVRILVLHARFDSTSRRLLVEVSLRNTGPQVISIPVSRDAGVHRDGHRDRRSLVLKLSLKQGHNEGISQVAGVTFGSASVAGSILELLPGQGIRFRMALQLPGTGEQQEVNKSTPTSLRAECWEQLIADDEYGLTSQSAIIESPPVPVHR